MLEVKMKWSLAEKMIISRISLHVVAISLLLLNLSEGRKSWESTRFSSVGSAEDHHSKGKVAFRINGGGRMSPRSFPAAMVAAGAIAAHYENADHFLLPLGARCFNQNAMSV
ncbi:hypothetical protein Q1695_004500 [Nippostrongylus brasiliensis]|nr:hypothetical protein Q1695_004500 [Nippostrongylus brasiliensis]